MSSNLGVPAIPIDVADEARASTHRQNFTSGAAVQSDVSMSSGDARTYQGDRRKSSLRSFVYGAFNPRRRRIRREGDKDHSFLDWHPTQLLVVCTMIMALSVADGFLTIHLLQNGAKELNPLMAFLISNNPILFALAKISLTIIGVVTLVITAHMQLFRLVKASSVLYFFLLVHVVLVSYQTALVLVPV
jgi:hypothetical protein